MTTHEADHIARCLRNLRDPYTASSFCNALNAEHGIISHAFAVHPHHTGWTVLAVPIAPEERNNHDREV